MLFKTTQIFVFVDKSTLSDMQYLNILGGSIEISHAVP